MKGRIHDGRRRADFADYERFFAQEHLVKFTPKEVNFQNSSDRSERCGVCYHWFQNPASGWTPCEIMRLGGRQPVPASGVCKFQTSDGKTYPLLNVL